MFRSTYADVFEGVDHKFDIKYKFGDFGSNSLRVSHSLISSTSTYMADTDRKLCMKI